MPIKVKQIVLQLDESTIWVTTYDDELLVQAQ